MAHQLRGPARQEKLQQAMLAYRESNDELAREEGPTDADSVVTLKGEADGWEERTRLGSLADNVALNHEAIDGTHVSVEPLRWGEEAHLSAAAWATSQCGCTPKSCRPVCSPTYMALTARARSVRMESRCTYL